MGDFSGDGDPREEKNQLDETTDGYIRNVKKFIYISAPSLTVLFISLSSATPRWLQTAGMVGMTVAALFWCNATCHLLKYIRIKRKEAADGK